MGVDLGDLFHKEKISLKDLHDRIIVIDAHNVIHQFLSIIRQRDGTPLKDSQGRITSHLSGLYYRTANLVEARIKPVYVFDGEPHLLKARTLEQRKERRQQAEQEWKEAKEKGDLETARIKAQQTSRVTEEIVQQSKALLEGLGIPYVQAPSEAEAQASYIVREGDGYAVGSQDFDSLLFGVPLLVRNLALTGRRRLPGKKAYVKVNPELIRLQPQLKTMGIVRKQLVDMAILIGTDFNEGIKGIGPKKSLQMIQKTGNVENALATFGNSSGLSFSEIRDIRKIFLKPKVTDDYSFQWSLPEKEAVLRILCDQHQFSQERVEPTLEKFATLKQMMKQKNLFEF
jgi:flap endonuclease-1